MAKALEQKKGVVYKQKIIDINDYYHIINKEETAIMFHNLEEIFTRIFDLELHNKKVRRKIEGTRNASNYSTNQSYIS